MLGLLLISTMILHCGVTLELEGNFGAIPSITGFFKDISDKYEDPSMYMDFMLIFTQVLKNGVQKTELKNGVQFDFVTHYLPSYMIFDEKPKRTFNEYRCQLRVKGLGKKDRSSINEWVASNGINMISMVMEKIEEMVDFLEKNMEETVMRNGRRFDLSLQVPERILKTQPKVHLQLTIKAY